MTMLDNVVWALVLVAILVVIVRRVGGPRPPGSPGSIAARLRAAEDELRELRGEIRLLVERVWFLEEGRPAPPGARGPVPPARSSVTTPAVSEAPSAETGGPAGAQSAAEMTGGAIGPASPLVPVAPHAPPPLAAPIPAPAQPSRPAGAAPPPAAVRPGHELEQRIGARWTTWLGVIAILFALGFFLRWAVEREILGPLARVLVGAAGGTVLLAAGQRLHRRRDLAYLSAGLSGCGLAALYLSLYAAHSVYALIGAPAAFYLIFLVTVAGAVVAVTTDRQATAVLTLLGGLLTPMLLSAVRPAERALLGYLLVLDCLALAVARYRSWPAVGYLAWAGTALLLWPEMLREPEPGLVSIRLMLLSAIFALFLILPLVREAVERRRERELDLGLIVLNAAGYFGALYATLGWSSPDVRGPSALLLAALYAAVAERCRRRVPDGAATAMVHLGVAVTFLTIGLGLVLRGPWITLAWAAEGLALLAVAVRMGNAVAAWGGLGALLLAGWRVLSVDPSAYVPGTRVWNAPFWAHVAVVGALALGGRWARRLGADQPRGLGGERARDVLWLAASLVLAALLWREPPGVWPAILLSFEAVALGWLGAATRAQAFLVATPLLCAVVFTRLFGADAPLARRAATNLVNLPLLVRIGACVAMILAGRGLVRAGLREPRGESWVPAGRLLSGAGAVVLIGVLSAGWTAHQNVARSAALRASDWAAAEDVRWRTQVGLSVLWTASAAVALLWGFVRSVPAARYGGLALLGLVLVKVFTVDLEAVSTGYRVTSFLVLGLALLGVSYLYQRARRSS